MCKWNPPNRRCPHGHTEHEELPNPNLPSQPSVTWCNACWTVCAFESGVQVKKGFAAALSDAVNGTKRAPPYITLIDQHGEFRAGRRPTRTSGMKPVTGISSNRTQPLSQFATLPPMAEAVQVPEMPASINAGEPAAYIHPSGTSGVPVAYVHPSEAALLANGMQAPVESTEPVDTVEPMGPMQIHNLARYEKFEDGIEEQR